MKGLLVRSFHIMYNWKYMRFQLFHLDIHPEIDNGERLKTKFFDKCDDLTFPVVNFPFISSNSPASPAY